MLPDLAQVLSNLVPITILISDFLTARWDSYVFIGRIISRFESSLSHSAVCVANSLVWDNVLRPVCADMQNWMPQTFLGPWPLSLVPTIDVIFGVDLPSIAIRSGTSSV